MNTSQHVVAETARQSDVARTDGSKQFLCLAIGNETYAVGIDTVREILEVGRMTPLPLTPPFVRGVMNLRGSVVPVIDMKARFGDTPSDSVVILETDHHGADGPLVVGALVDGVSEVLEIPEENIDPVPALGTRIPREFLMGMAKPKGALICMLDVDRVFERSAMASLIAAYATH
jgi:purine-binding chemotaxis protein CheW